MANRPDILYIMADQLRPQSCGYSGDDRAQTPHLDRLAGEGKSLGMEGALGIQDTPACLRVARPARVDGRDPEDRAGLQLLEEGISVGAATVGALGVFDEQRVELLVGD